MAPLPKPPDEKNSLEREGRTFWFVGPKGGFLPGVGPEPPIDGTAEVAVSEVAPSSTPVFRRSSGSE